MGIKWNCYPGQNVIHICTVIPSELSQNLQVNYIASWSFDIWVILEHKVLHLCSLPSRGFTPQMTQKNFHCVLCSSYGLSYICGQDLGYEFKIIINAPGLHHPRGWKPPRSLFYGRMGWMQLCGDTREHWMTFAFKQAMGSLNPNFWQWRSLLEPLWMEIGSYSALLIRG